MIRLGATSDRYYRTRLDGLRIVNKLLQNVPCILQIQEEMEGGIKLTETTAGKEVNERIEELQAQHRNEIQALKVKMEEALKSKDLEIYKKRLEEQAEAMKKLEEARVARERLLDATIKQQQAQIADLQKSGGCVIL